MTITEQALADLLLKYFTTLEPVGKDVTLKSEMKKVAQPDGSTKVEMVPTKGDAYIPKDLSNAMAKAIAKAIHPQLPGAGGVTPWFEWNGVDLSQFDTVQVGTNVTGHVEQVVEYGGFKWIDMSVTANGGNGATACTVLPISTTPPSTDYVVTYDFISRQVIGSVVGAGAVVRFSNFQSAYYCRYYDRTAASGFVQDFGRFSAGPSITRFEDMDDPRLDGLDRGCRIAMSVQGQSSGAILKLIIGEPAIYLDTTPITGVGKAGLWQSTGGTIGTCRNYYRNIRCYRASDVEHFLM